ncbi:SMAD/FHA domain-containing protein [Paraphysoderma sedebokerense]|nr:SMAD/FHA domain-containing protein [Paraphysoderma sedebokerense]
MTSVSTDSPQSTLGRSNNYPSEKENDSGGSSLNLSKKASKRLLKQINNMPQSTPPASNYPSVTLVLTSSDAGANGSNKATVIKTIDLFENNPVKIGRQTNSKTVPSLSNGFFDSKVLSRNHAEIWVEGGKIYIKDTKSSNGTFVNGKRLSEENHESAPVELKNGDTVDFGIDIVGDDGSTLLYKRVTVKASVIGSNEKPNMETPSPAAALNLSQSQANALYKIDDRA